MIHPLPTDPAKPLHSELIEALEHYLQAYFPALDVWYVKTYTPDDSSQEANIAVSPNAGHLGIGKKRLGAAHAESVAMKVYNLGSDNWIFFFDQPRLQKAGLNIGKSKSHCFGKCNLELLQNFFDQNIHTIQSIRKISWQE